MEKENARNSITSAKVHWDTIRSIGYRELFSHISQDQYVNSVLYTKAIEILKRRDGTNYEDLYVYDVYQQRFVIANKHSSTLLQVQYSKAEDRKLKYVKNHYLIVLHNHPNNSFVSGSDLNSMYKRNYNKGVIIQHDGSIQIYSIKTNPHGRLFDLTIDKFQKPPYYMSVEDACLKTIALYKQVCGLQVEVIRWK